MSRISLIAAIDTAGGLGMGNQLLCHLPADLQHFKKITMGKPIIMGRKTFDSIGKPLPGRLNIVLSQKNLNIEGVMVFNSLAKALEYTNDQEETIIIGGGQLFAEAFVLAERLYITRIHHQFTADVFFPSIDETIWQVVHHEFHSSNEKNHYDMTFYTYERAN